MADKILTWTNYVTSEFQKAFKVDLWKVPSTQVIELEKEMVNKDSFIGCLGANAYFMVLLNEERAIVVTLKQSL